MNFYISQVHESYSAIKSASSTKSSPGSGRSRKYKSG